jgi:signal transduction histidine kinase
MAKGRPCCENVRTMIAACALRLWPPARRALANPHLWVVFVLSAILLVIYQAWPWPDYQFTKGFWSFFPWLSHLRFVLCVELPYDLFGVLFLIPIIYGSMSMSWPGGLFAWALSLIWVLPELLSWSSRREYTNLLLLLLPVLVAAIWSAERRWREEEKKYYAAREHKHQAYVAKLVEGQETERQRIAQEIHDDTLQTLLVVANKLDSLATSTPPDERTDGLLWAREKLTQSMEDLRRLSMNLRPNILDNFGLVAGVRWLVDNIGPSSCHFTTLVKGEAPKMSSLAEVTVFRVVQESVWNIQRHAQARNASVILEFADDRLMLDIQDDGVGFDRTEHRIGKAGESRLGLIGMEQRIMAVEGTMQLQSSPGHGTRLQATIPYYVSDQVV